MPTRPPLSSTSPLSRYAPAASVIFVLGLAVGLPGPKKPPLTQRVEIVPGEAWADVLVVPAGPLSVAEAEAKRVQKRPPCLEQVEVEYDGLCWLPHVSRPPKCGPGMVAAAGYCLMRVPAPTPPNTSLGK